MDTSPPRPSDHPTTRLIDQFLFAIGLEVKPATAADYEKCLRPLRALDKPISEVTINDLRLAYAQLRERTMRYTDHPSRPTQAGGLSVYTLHKHIRVWKRFFNWLVEEQVIAASPAHRLRRPRLPKETPRDLRYDDLLRLLDAAQRSSKRDYAIVCVLAGTAIRVGGLVGLQIDDVDLDARVIVVHEKGDKARRVHLPERAANALRRYLDEERPGDAGEFVFVGMRGQLTTGGIYQVLKRLARHACVQGRFNPHSFRHGFARGAIQRGANPKELQEILSHEDVRTTLMFYNAPGPRCVGHDERGPSTHLRRASTSACVISRHADRIAASSGGTQRWRGRRGLFELHDLRCAWTAPHFGHA